MHTQRIKIWAQPRYSLGEKLHGERCDRLSASLTGIDRGIRFLGAELWAQERKDYLEIHR
jgi:hypothetical protein